jgi:hypothetical protein
MTTQEKIEALKECICDTIEAIIDGKACGFSPVTIAEYEAMLTTAKSQLAKLEGEVK